MSVIVTLCPRGKAGLEVFEGEQDGAGFLSVGLEGALGVRRLTSASVWLWMEGWLITEMYGVVG